VARAPHLRKGREAEERALTFLTVNGLRLVARNYRCRSGEIDLIMEEGDTLVLVEVRYRTSGRFGDALESVTPRKQARLIRCAAHYLNACRVERPVRFDVVAMMADERSPSVTWVRDAFQA
jgi:putative endonuclease